MLSGTQQMWVLQAYPEVQTSTVIISWCTVIHNRMINVFDTFIYYYYHKVLTVKGLFVPHD